MRLLSYLLLLSLPYAPLRCLWDGGRGLLFLSTQKKTKKHFRLLDILFMYAKLFLQNCFLSVNHSYFLSDAQIVSLIITIVFNLFFCLFSTTLTDLKVFLLSSNVRKDQNSFGYFLAPRHKVISHLRSPDSF